MLPYRAMAHNNAWANCRLLRACAQLSQEEFTQQRTGFFPSLRATLNHILVLDRFYVDAMEGGNLGPAAWSRVERLPCSSRRKQTWTGACWQSCGTWAGPAFVGLSACIAGLRFNMNGWTACCCICFSIRSTIAGRPTPC